jgi:hypothetical protein
MEGSGKWSTWQRRFVKRTLQSVRMDLASRASVNGLIAMIDFAPNKAHHEVIYESERKLGNFFILSEKIDMYRFCNKNEFIW